MSDWPKQRQTSRGVPHPNSPTSRTFNWSSLGVPHPNSPAGRTANPQPASFGLDHRHGKPQSQKSQDDLLNELHPVFRRNVDLILIDLRKLGWKPTIIFARRTNEQQRDAIRRGASPTMLSWHLQDTVGLLPVSRGHIQVVRGNAVDIVDERYGWEGKAANLDFPFWKDLGAAAHNHTCQWGGDWKPVRRMGKDGKMHLKGQRDVAHVQMFFTEEREQDSFTA